MDSSFGNFRLSRYVALKHSLGNMRFGSFGWELSLGMLRLMYSARAVSLGNF